MRLRSLLLVIALATSSASAQSRYKLIEEIPIAGDEGWDYLSIDAHARRLYVTHGNKIVVVDLDKNAVVGEIADTPGVHGFALGGHGFSSNGTENQASVVDLKTLKTIAKVETGRKPDAIVFEIVHNEVYVFNGLDNSATVFNALTHQVTATIPLGGKPEFAVAECGVEHIGFVYCNLEDTNEVVAIDGNSHSVTSRWSLSPGGKPTGLALDPINHRLFVGCRGLLVMLDLLFREPQPITNRHAGKVLSTVPIGLGVDGCAFDEKTHLAFASCGSGTVTIAKTEGISGLTVVQTLETKRGARTMALDPKTHRIYLATADFKDEPVSPGSRPARVPGTFRVLVYGPE